jgi:hypothetical protein
LLLRPEFLAGELDTGFIERMLAAERGAEAPAADQQPQEEELAALAAAFHDSKRPAAPVVSGAMESNWKRAGRDELMR